MKKIEKLEGTITATQPESKQEKMPELEWNERGDFNRRVAEGTREFIKNSQPESKQGWRERFDQEFNMFGILPDNLLDDIKQFVSSEIAEAKREIEEKYNELLMAVGNKYKGETRHQTALRYIKNAEKNNGQVGTVKEPDVR